MNLKGIQTYLAGPRHIPHGTSAGKIVIIDPWIMHNPKCPEPEKKVHRIDALLFAGHFGLCIIHGSIMTILPAEVSCGMWRGPAR